LLRSRQLLERADAIVTCNPREAELLRARYPDLRIVVQPHGVSRRLYETDHRAAARRALPQIRNRSVLLCLGRIDPVKNQHWLVEQTPELLGRHPEALLVLAGSCTDEAYGNALQQRLVKLGLTDRVLLIAEASKMVIDAVTLLSAVGQ